MKWHTTVKIYQNRNTTRWSVDLLARSGLAAAAINHSKLEILIVIFGYTLKWRLYGCLSVIVNPVEEKLSFWVIARIKPRMLDWSGNGAFIQRERKSVALNAIFETWNHMRYFTRKRISHKVTCEGFHIKSHVTFHMWKDFNWIRLKDFTWT